MHSNRYLLNITFIPPCRDGCLWTKLRNITITILDIIHRPAFYLKLNSTLLYSLYIGWVHPVAHVTMNEWYTCLIKHAETLLRTKDCCTHSTLQVCPYLTGNTLRLRYEPNRLILSIGLWWWYNTHNSEHYPISCLLFETRRFGDCILAPSSDRT
jgi:hypothetical protein